MTQLENRLERPLLILSFIWLSLVIIELIRTTSGVFVLLGTIIWMELDLFDPDTADSIIIVIFLTCLIGPLITRYAAIRMAGAALERELGLWLG